MNAEHPRSPSRAAVYSCRFWTLEEAGVKKDGIKIYPRLRRNKDNWWKFKRIIFLVEQSFPFSYDDSLSSSTSLSWRRCALSVIYEKKYECISGDKDLEIGGELTTRLLMERRMEISGTQPERKGTPIVQGDGLQCGSTCNTVTPSSDDIGYEV